jgi:hypothetical protein
MSLGATCVLIDDKTDKYSCSKCLEKHHSEIYEIIFGEDVNPVFSNRRKF